MTLEKLLIFGFALALMAALTMAATGTTKTRVEQKNGYRDKVDGLTELAK